MTDPIPPGHGEHGPVSQPVPPIRDVPCPKCGATLEPRGAFQFGCQYCGHLVRLGPGP